MVSDRAFGDLPGVADESNRPTVDPRHQDAALIEDVIIAGPTARSAAELARRLSDAGVRVGVFRDSGEPDADGIDRPGRTAVLVHRETSVTAARERGFGLVIGVGRTAESARRLRDRGADHVVEDLAEVRVRHLVGRMSNLPDALAHFTEVVDRISGRQMAVFFDFDGTLSPIVEQPETAALTGGAAQALESLSHRCPVGVLSGRDLGDVRERVGVPGLWYAGSHGFETASPDGTRHRNETAAQAIPLLHQAALELTERLAPSLGVVVEHKRYAVAVHYRNASTDATAPVTAAARDIGRRLGLRVTSGRKVVELRPDVDWDKGRTLNWIAGQISDDRRVLPIFLGDDLTDEDGFDAVHDDGLGVVVRHDEDGDRATNARFSLDDPDHVRQFIDRLIELSDRDGRPPVTAARPG